MSAYLSVDTLFVECLVLVLRCILYLVVLCILLAISLIDAETMLIPDKLNLALLVCGILAVFFVPEVSLDSRLVGFFCISIPLLLFSLVIPGSFGGGDIKLMAAAGFLLGWQGIFLAAILGLSVGGVYGVYLIVTGKKRASEHFALGPSLCIGIALAMLLGSTLMRSAMLL